MADDYRYYRPTLTSPAESAESVTPAAEDLSSVSRSLWVGGSGDVVVKMAAGNTVTFAGVSGGTLLPIRVSQVLPATTATGIVALW